MRRQLQCDQIATPPPVRWTLLFLALLGSHVWALRSNSGVTDPWGENQRPKLYTDYLTQHSGKKLFLKLCILRMCTGKYLDRVTK